jgi:hypothetical protein
VGSPLNIRQQKFIACYQGNGTAAARRAGYKGDEHTLSQVAYENLRKPDIAEAIKAKNKLDLDKCIADSDEVKSMWTDTMRKESVPIDARLRAGELLEKSRGGFIQVVEHSGPGGVPIAVDAGIDMSHLGLDAITKLLGMTDVPKGGYRTGASNGNGNGNGHHRGS